MITPIRISKSSNFGNKLLGETNTDNMPIPRIGEYLELASGEYIQITKVEYCIDIQNNANNCIYIVGRDL